MRITALTITIEDEASPLEQRIGQSLDIIEANAANGAPTVILVHPNDPASKARAEEAILNQLPPGIPATSLETFARFWRARDQLRWTVRSAADPNDLTLEVDPREAISGLTVEFGPRVADADRGARVIEGHKVILPDLRPGDRTSFHVHLIS